MTTILHVENSSTVRAILKTRLRRHDPTIDIIEARSLCAARVALAMLRHRQIDLVVIDWSLPDGLASDILPLLRGLPCVVLTSSPGDARGFDLVIDKGSDGWSKEIEGMP